MYRAVSGDEFTRIQVRSLTVDPFPPSSRNYDVSVLTEGPPSSRRPTLRKFDFGAFHRE